MKTDDSATLRRRDWFRISAGALLASGFWPGCARWSDKGSGGEFTFVVINDIHFQSPRCAAWFERVRASVAEQRPKPDFCLMVGDLVEHGTRNELGPIHEALRSFRMDVHCVPGNHDYISDTDRSVYDRLFPNSLNYFLQHCGWQVIALDSTQGLSWQNTRIQTATLAWVDNLVPKLSRAAPTIIFTHFPLGLDLKYRPENADDLLNRFIDLNLIAVFNGHFHGFTQRRSGATVLTTNRCCAISRDNHDGTSEKGYFFCSTKEGQVNRRFVEVIADPGLT